MHLVPILVSFLVLTTTPVLSWGSTLVGQFKGSGSSAVRFSDSYGKELELANGPVELVYQNPGWVGLFSLFTGERQIVLRQGERELAFDLTTTDFRGFGDFRTPTLIGQSRKTQINRRTDRQSISCKYSGYCYTCRAGLTGFGTVNTDCDFKYYSACEGSQYVLVELTDYQTSTTISVVDGARVLGVIEAEPEDSQEDRVVETISSCQ